MQKRWNASSTFFPRFNKKKLNYWLNFLTISSSIEKRLSLLFTCSTMHFSHSTADCIAFELTRDVSQFSNLIKIKELWKNGKNWMQRQNWEKENINQLEFHLLIYVEKCNLNITDKWAFITVNLHNKLESLEMQERIGKYF